MTKEPERNLECAGARQDEQLGLRRFFPPLDLPGGLLVAYAAVALAIALAALFTVPPHYPKYPIDAYYYLEMARNVAQGKGPVVRFEQGVPLKFFPGYPLVLGVFSLAAAPHAAWYALHALLIVALFVLSIAATRALGFSRSVAWSTVTLVLTHPVFLKWATLPYSELLALTLGLALLLLTYRARSTPRSGTYLAAGLCGGYAMITRPTAAFYVALAVASLVLSRRRPKVQALGSFLIGAAALPLLYVLWRLGRGEPPLPYWHEFLARPSDTSPGSRFLDALLSFIALRKVQGANSAIDWGLTIGNFLFFMAILLSLRGYLGPLARAAGTAVLVYLGAHSLWSYTSERFIMLVLPAGVLLLARLFEWLSDKQRDADSAEQLTRLSFAACILSWSMLMWSYTPSVFTNHSNALRENTGRPREMAELANSNASGAAWIEIGPEFAYFYKGQTYFDHNEPFFFHRTNEDEGQLFVRLKVRWVVTRDTPEQWLAKHPQIARLAPKLQRIAHDGTWTLYRVSLISFSSASRVVTTENGT
ncbi:MAG: hypothetical protein ACP5QZ_04895 [Candidatus Sumerlaeaceae bacterium]